MLEKTRRVGFLLLFAGLAVALSGCPRQPDQVEPEVMELEPMFFTIIKKGGAISVQDFEVSELFDKAGRLLAEGKPAQAKKTYMLVATDLPDTEAAGFAWLYVALCEVAMEKPGAALEAAEKALPLVTDEEDKAFAKLVRIQALEMLGEWGRVESEGRALLDEGVPDLWVARISLYLGQAYAQQEQLDKAEKHYRAGLELLLSEMPLKEQYRDTMVASAYFRLGQVFKKLFERMKLKLPVERMLIDMSDKLAVMRQAEKHFLDAVTTRNHEWSPRAGFEVARLYETFAIDLMQAEVPEDLSKLEKQVYTDELNLKILPFLRRAKDIHLKNVAMCDTYRFSSAWRKKSRQRAGEIGGMIDNLTRTDGR